MYQTNKSYFLLLLVILFWPVNLQAHKTGIAYHQVKAYCISQESTPVIDGQLNDQVWKLAEPINNFVQIRPSREQPATEDTEVRILYDKSRKSLVPNTVRSLTYRIRAGALSE